MKYIDIDKLIAELERWRDKAKEDYNKNHYSMGRCDALAEFRNFMVSLQEEQPEVDLDKEIEEQINMYYNECEKKLNQMSDDDTDIGFLTLNSFARHFYELGLNARKEESK